MRVSLDLPTFGADTSGLQAEPHHQVLDLDDAERVAVVCELRSYADYREGDLDLDTHELAAELGSDPSYAYDEAAIQEALDRERLWIEQFQQRQVAATAPWRELADQVEQTGQLDFTDEATRRDVGEVVDNTGWRLDGDPLDAPPQGMRRVVETVQAPLTASRPSLASERRPGADVEPSQRIRWATVTPPTRQRPEEERGQPTQPAPGISM